jgi:S-adenosylmethionine hydrolase
MAGTATTGQIVHIDHYGNAITDLRRLDLPAPAATCRFACGRFVALGLQPTYASVPTGSAVALIGSYGTVELAQRDASAATSWQLTVGQTVVVEGQPTSPAPSG